MAVHDHTEFEQLFAAYTNGVLTQDERQRLYELAGRDVGRRGALAEVEAVHELIGVEKKMRTRVMQPSEPAEEADESYRRLAKAAARAEQKLRDNMLLPTTIDVPRTPVPHTPAGAAGSRRVIYFAAAAVLVIAAALFFALNHDSAPRLDGDKPTKAVLGVRGIQTLTTVTADSPELSWGRIEYARTYEASVLDANGRAVLRRAAGLSRFTHWQLSDQDLSTMRQHEGDLYLRVVGRDENGAVVGQTQEPAKIELQ